MRCSGLVGAISILFGTYRLWADRGGALAAPARSPGWVGTLFGVASGFTSQIAHAGQPPFQIWVLPKRLPRDVLVGTTAIFFAATNWLKVPAYWALGQFSHANLLATASLIPVAIASTFAGVWLVRRVSPARFYTAIYALMVLVGVKLVWDAVGKILRGDDRQSNRLETELSSAIRRIASASSGAIVR